MSDDLHVGVEKEERNPWLQNLDRNIAVKSGGGLLTVKYLHFVFCKESFTDES